MSTRARAPINVALSISRRQNIYHASALYAGLDLLHRRRAISLTFRRRPPGTRFVEDQGVVSLAVTREDVSGSSDVAIDLFDQSDRFMPSVLERCDVYFKRSYHEPDLSAVAPELRAKIRPFGLNFAARTKGSTKLVLARTGADRLLDGATGVRSLYTYLSLPFLSELERRPASPVEPTIVFQTRVWREEETGPGEHHELNSRRVELVRALRAAFGDRFHGGLVPTSYAASMYPDALTPFSSRRRQYVAMSAKNLIGVYTRGLHRSTAFKLAEYLAASQCIVSEVPRNELPVPLQPGVHFLPFDTPGQCVDACRRLLADSSLAAHMRAENYDYYWREVEPAAHMLNVIEVSLRSLEAPAPAAAEASEKWRIA